jgi:hypothetical protein
MVMMLFIGGKFFSTVFLSMGGGDVVADVLVGSGHEPLGGAADHDGHRLPHGHVHRLGGYFAGYRAHLHAHCHGAGL